MFKWKKAAAVLAAAVVAASCTACSTFGSSTAYAVTIDGVQLKAGVYIYYSYASYMELTQTLQSENSELDVDDDDVVKKQTMDGVSAETWIQNKTMEYCQRHVAISKKCEELGLELDEDQESEISDTIEAFWASNGEIYERNGISKDSVTQVLRNTYLTDEVFLYYYDVDGAEGVTEDELKEYYEENNARVRYIQFNLTDGNGEELDDAGKEDMKHMVEDYLGELEALEGDEAAMDEEMDAIQSEYNAYVTSISEEAAAETATSATDEEGNEIPAETTTTTTTTAETTTTTAAEESADTTETAGADDTAETTTAEATEETETTTAADESTDEEETTDTTTTTVPYASEKIIAKVTTDEDTDPEDVTYSPSEKAYNFIFDEAELGVPAMVEDESAYYLIVRRDITARMTEDDLWTEDQINSVISGKYADTFEDMLDGWCEGQNVEKNDRAIKRYDAFKIDMDSSQA
ncbi:MAG: hypothetical protein ACI4XB_08740 [Ruminococcus sp.]